MPGSEQKPADDSDIVLEADIETGNLKDPAEAVKTLREKLGVCRKERQEYLDGWQRCKADMINARRREEEERGEFLKFSEKELIKELLPALDSFHTAFGNKEAWEKVDLTWRMGVQHIYMQLRSVLEKHGVTLIDPKIGEPFSPKLHASVEAVSVAEKEKDHTVVAVVQKGYGLYGKILEPAKVKVGEYISHADSTQN